MRYEQKVECFFLFSDIDNILFFSISFIADNVFYY